MQPYEKLGAFYLGRVYDQQSASVSDDVLLYDAKDLTTHAVCVGMTGSGKTGLCVSMLEEAAIDGIPAICIDPKGDLGNLKLTFPRLRPEDFRPWIDESAAARRGRTPDEFAADTASLWKKGLGDWAQDGTRIRRLREAADVTIYTPGSNAGRPLRVLRSFAAPPAALLDDADALRERIVASASGLLTLLGLEADPIRSREHILLSCILRRSWEQGRDLDLATLVREVQSPGIERIGVMDLDTFFPSGDRAALAMSLNSLIASPGFAAWMEGEPLSIPGLLWTPEGKPRLSVLSIAHLSDAERMFFVTVLLNELVAWMRTQPGTSSLRAILYMDEIFGYFPPTAKPPSKMPMLTLLKQARAYGIGVVLATQNPVDLDYKGLSNTGTWFLGRLQAERDKARVLEGLEGASTATGSTFDRARMEATLAGLGSRVFLMNNVHDDEPVLFHTRWAMSYLRGPLTRSQIRDLTAAPPSAKSPKQARKQKQTQKQTKTTKRSEPAGDRPIVGPDVPEFFLPWDGNGGGGDGLRYRPALLGSAQLHFVSARNGIDDWVPVSLMSPLGANPQSRTVWKDAEPLNAAPTLNREAEAGFDFAPLPAAATRAKSFGSWSKALSAHLYRERTLDIHKCKALKAVSGPGETEGDFRVRLRQLAREQRDVQVAKLEKRYGPKLARLQDRIRRAEDRVEREQSQYGQQKLQTAISVGATVLGALFGRKVASVGTVGRASTAMRGAGRATREKGDVARAADELEAQRLKLADLEAEFEKDVEAVREACDPDAFEVEAVRIRPRKSDITVDQLALVWQPERR